MKTDSLIRSEGINILIANLGLIETERFIMLIQKDSFDYTQWQENLFADMTIKQIHNNTEKLQKKNKKRELGTLQNKGSVKFADDFTMTDEELLNS
ncbi:MAG: hypothetical protein LBT09_12940 [Planctomycetaceae bacterium]|nr:hypothetical protein [Planctomycetaceae bacterium]